MKQPFFVVTTGRSGSLSLALTLSAHPYICALHEPYKAMIPLAHKLITKAETVYTETLRNYLKAVVPVPAGPQICGIVDHKLTHFIPHLADLFPGSKFIWLTRDGRKVVKSIVARGWYTTKEREGGGTIWQNYRIGADQAGLMGKADWVKLTQFERCCWYWAWMQETCIEELVKLDVGQWTLFPVEEGNDMLEGLQSWLGLEPAALTMYRANIGAPASPEPWTEEQERIFERICGSEMDRCYKGWRDDDD